MLQKQELSASLMGHLARKQTLRYLFFIPGWNFAFQNGLALTIKTS